MSVRDIPARWRAAAPALRSVLRLVLAFVFVQAGTMKLFAFPMGMPPDGATARVFSEIGIAGVLETFGGALLFVGLFSRTVAFVFAGEMAVAYFQFSAPLGFWPIMTNGALPLVCCFLMLYLSAAGPGPWSVDGWRSRSGVGVTPAGIRAANRASPYE